MNIWINLLTPKNLNICMKTWKYIQKCPKEIEAETSEGM